MDFFLERPHGFVIDATWMANFHKKTWMGHLKCAYYHLLQCGTFTSFFHSIRQLPNHTLEQKRSQHSQYGVAH